MKKCSATTAMLWSGTWRPSANSFRAHLVATADSEGEKDGEDSIEKRKAQLLQARNSIQVKVGFVGECNM